MNLLWRVATATTVSILCVLGAFPRGASAATLTTIYRFPTGVWPMTGVVSGPGGALYGATNKTIYELVPDAAGHFQEKTILGAGAATLVGSATALYAATNTGNTVFELLPPAKGSALWKATVIHEFKGGKDGSQPRGLALAADGSLYGTTQLGGGATACGSNNGVPTGCGTFFRLSKVNGKWGEWLIHAFKGGADGAIPVASPSFDAAGNVYLTTSSGAVRTAKSSDFAPRDIADGCGEFATLEYQDSHGGTFDDYFEEVAACVILIYANGYYYPESVMLPVEGAAPPSKMSPAAGARANELIFTTVGGGDGSSFCLATSFDGCGLVGELIRTSSTTKPWEGKVLHEFSGSDGFSPMGYLTPDGADRIYGVASSALGKCPDQGCGEIFALAYGKTGWAWDGVVYHFTTDAFPVSQLTLYKGKLLGTTSGYNISLGTIYELTP